MKEVHFAEVTNNTTDPTGEPFRQGEVMFKCESLLSDGVEYPIPARPSFPFATTDFGVFFVPPPGSIIEVEIEAGLGSVGESEVRYRAMLFSEEREPPSELTENYPYRKGVKLPSGILMFDDSPGEELIRFFHKLGTGMEFTKDGDMLREIVRDEIVNVIRNMTFTISGDREVTVTGETTESSGTKHRIDAPAIELGGTTPVAREGDPMVGTTSGGDHVHSVTGTISQGSTKVKAG